MFTLLTAQTTLIPFASLPPCAQSCGPLFDVNGACVPPAKPAADVGTYGACFCADPRVAPLSTGTVGVCDAACAATPGAMGSVQSWFTSFCANDAKAGVTAAPGGPTTTVAGGSNGGSSSGGSSSGGGGDW